MRKGGDATGRRMERLRPPQKANHHRSGEPGPTRGHNSLHRTFRRRTYLAANRAETMARSRERRAAAHNRHKRAARTHRGPRAPPSFGNGGNISLRSNDPITHPRVVSTVAEQSNEPVAQVATVSRRA